MEATVLEIIQSLVLVGNFHPEQTGFYFTMKIWKDVPRYEGRYKVSNHGDVLSISKNKTIVLSGSISSRGYKQFTLSWTKKGRHNVYGGHQLVAMAFLNHTPNGNNGLIIDHINSNKRDNRLDNLRIVSNRENCAHYKKPASKYFGVHKYKDGKWMAGVWHNGRNIVLGVCDSEILAHNRVLKYIDFFNLDRVI